MHSKTGLAVYLYPYPYSIPCILRLLSVAILMAASSLACAQSAASDKSPANRPNPKNQRNPANRPNPQKRVVPKNTSELSERLAATQAAQQSGDPQSVIQANQRLLALALGEMAQLRFRVEAFSQAAELYKQSLDLEDVADNRVDLAITYLRMKQPTEALEESEKATLQAPKNGRAWNIKGKSWMMLKNYRKATESLARSISLEGNMEAAYSLATCFLALKEKARAELVFRDMLRTAGERGSMHVLFGRAYRDAGYMDDAKREMRRALAIDAKTPHAHYYLGLIKLIQNEWAPSVEVKDELRRELQYHPRHYLANYLLGAMASNAKEFAISDQYLRVSTDEQPQMPEPWTYLGLNAYSRGELRPAEEYLRKAIELTGTNESRSHYHIRKAYVALGRILIQTGRREEAAPWMEKAREAQRLGLGESQQKIAETFHSSGVGMGAVMPYISPENEEKAVPLPAFVDATAQLSASELAEAKLSEKEKEVALRQEKQLREILGTSYNDLGTAEARQKNFEKAREHFLEAERWNPDIPGLTRNVGIAAARVGDHATTIRALAKHLAAAPDDNVARMLLGLAYYTTEAYADAAKTIAPLGDAALADPGLAYPFAVSLTRSGRIPEAEKALDKLEQQAATAENYLLLGQQWADAGNAQRALAALNRAAELDPNLQRVHYHAGLVYIREGRPADAEREFEIEQRLSPGNPDVQYHLGYAHLLLSQREQAQALFQSVVEANPQHAEAQYQLGKLLLDQEQVKTAIGHLEAAVRLSPEKDFVHYQLQAAYRKDGRIADADRELEAYRAIKAKNREKTLPIPTSKLTNDPSH